ncbi:MAG: hypothetical protein EOP06_06910 [Proteobacteria bacterium]|nr:MAG: hypothetical protein EOP06_06910 [Pseudomonadota bacterium]
MNGKILATRTERGSDCHLCEITLEEYVLGLSEAYQDYDIQREIVSNVYLDRLVDTVISKGHIPPIVLVVAGEDFTRIGDKFEISDFKILDGLQRTFRLQAIRKTIRYCIDNIDDPLEILNLSKFRFSRQFSSDLGEINSNTSVLRTILEAQAEHGIDFVRNTFATNYQWFEIWVNLSLSDEVRKMLTLNAGHKPVSPRHQLELLFLNLLPILKANEADEFTLVREKEVSATQFSKNRACGDFHFAHIITSLLSLAEGKPVPPSTTVIQGIQNDEEGIDKYADIITPDFIQAFIHFLISLDQTISDQYPENGPQWMGREIVLSGLFGGIGASAVENEESREDVMSRLAAIVEGNPEILQLDEFEKARNNVELSKVNIGNVNRRAVFMATKSLLEEDSPSELNWKHLFKGGAQ